MRHITYVRHGDEKRNYTGSIFVSTLPFTKNHFFLMKRAIILRLFNTLIYAYGNIGEIMCVATNEFSGTTVLFFVFSIISCFALPTAAELTCFRFLYGSFLYRRKAVFRLPLLYRILARFVPLCALLLCFKLYTKGKQFNMRYTNARLMSHFLQSQTCLRRLITSILVRSPDVNSSQRTNLPWCVFVYVFSQTADGQGKGR